MSTIVGEYSRPQKEDDLKYEYKLKNEDDLKDEDDLNNKDDLNALTACNAAPTVKSKIARGGPNKVLEWG